MGDLLVVGRIGRAHGIRGDVSVEVRTDAPELRFAPGAVLRTDPETAGPLTVETARMHSGRLLIRFEGIADRTAAEALREVLLVIDADDAGPAGEPDEDVWWDHELLNLEASTSDGDLLGLVSDVLHTPAGELLAIRRPDGAELLVPFVSEFVPVVDVPGGRVVVNPPAGLLEL
jgi:16S rRNA processing protein RimM